MRNAIALRRINGADGAFLPDQPLNGVPAERVALWVEHGVARYLDIETATAPPVEQAVKRAPVRRGKKK